MSATIAPPRGIPSTKTSSLLLVIFLTVFSRIFARICAALTRSLNAICDEGVYSVFEVDFDDSNKTLK